MERKTFPVIETYKDNEVSFRDIFSALWKGKWIIVSLTLVSFIFAIFMAVGKPNIYKSSILLVPAQEEQKGGLAGLAGQFGGLASIAGLNIGGGKSEVTEALAILKSQEFLTHFLQEGNIKSSLFIKNWNKESGQWEKPDSLLGSIWGWVKGGSNNDEKSNLEPSWQKAYQLFLSKHLSVFEDPKTGLVTVSVMAYQPEEAAHWVTLLVDKLNSHVRLQKKAEAERSIEYLNEQIRLTVNAEMQRVLYQLVEAQAKVAMLASVREDYVFRVIDPAFVPEQKYKPNRFQIVIVGAIAGCVFGILLVLFIQVLTENKKIE
ncbi:Wzz/FepE/Etk N-terminal domain-containing protein [Hahella aquimaris]|uniref:Wzz/FepE/Etk N-terminal domain-containing protein n=1 Tax=Hahella sp. HNIBRBA332 TaxID=3015983 RepID=UPI00273C7ABD|nr:Wzz/FepE/Etk N-terminal domain-containing protein [Hahella sp. HNIBRBA332]WLQ15451.1 Wzz/FepE/Etk N-terminal domain-containing protein [Hahella sp. HNIBRBA332]